ncbi:MAG: tyrosine-type recombinase/integrase [Peptococcaceae bacterium]
MINTSQYIFYEFFNFLRERGLTEGTIKNYQTDLTGFFVFFRNEVKDITSIDLKEYQAYLQDNTNPENSQLKPSTINRRFISLKIFLKFAKKQNHISRIPSFPRNIRIQKVRPKALNSAEQNRFLREAERWGKVKNIAMVRLLLSCGLRVGELVNLKLTDLDLGERHGRLTIRQGKGNKYREIPVPPEARKAVIAWLTEREKKQVKSEYLFPNRNGSRLSTRYVQQIIKNHGLFAKLDIHPHVLRHTAATNMLRAGSDLVAVAQILGHANLNTTMIYTRPDANKMAEILERSEI